MQILIVNLPLEGLSEADYLRLCADVAQLAQVEGFVSKVWLADAATALVGGAEELDRTPSVL